MARKKPSARRIEPRLDGPAPRRGALDLRLSEDDRTDGKGGRPKSGGGKSAGGKRRRGNSKRGGRRGKPSRGLWRPLGRLGLRLTYWGAVLGVWAALGFAGLLLYYASSLPSASDWQVPQRPPNIKIVAADGRLIGNRGDTGGEAVRLEHLPPYVAEAVIAIEDRRFYSHFGVDVIGLARATFRNVIAGRLVEGGSTISQQLAKNLFLQPDRTIKRKMQEVVLALWLENKFTKDQILELYLNRVYFGAGATGIDAAARRYFDKSATRLTIAEAAVLAGVLKAPSYFAPSRHPDRAEQRAQTVLMAMHREGFVSEAEAANALASPAAVSAAYRTRGAVHYVADHALSEVKRILGEIPQDLVVDTSIDLELQRTGEAVIRQAIDVDGDKRGVTQGALVAIDGDGGIRALVGGYDYDQSQFNRAVAGKRQPGSAFKPFVYLAALEQGFTPDSTRIDGRVSIGGWTPVNYDKKFRGRVTLTEALALSLNTVAATTAHTIGPANVVRTAQRLGISSKLQAHPSIALGTSEVTPLELTAAYVPFSNGGHGVIPHLVRRIATRSGKVLYQRGGSGPGRVVAPDHVAMMNRMMAAVMAEGTGRKAALKGWPAAGKTGTSQNLRDAWFVGYTGHLTAGVWFGNDDSSPSRSATGGNMPAEAWRTFMTAAHDGLAPVTLPGTEPILTAAADPAAPPGYGAGGRSPVLATPPSKLPAFLKRIFGGG